MQTQGKWRTAFDIDDSIGYFDIFTDDELIGTIGRCKVGNEELTNHNKDNAEYICKCVNNHEKLVEQLKYLLACFEDGEIDIDPALCIHVPNCTDLCPIGNAKRLLKDIDND